MNNSKLRPLETQVRLVVESCHAVLYTVIPNYGGTDLPVESVSLSAIIEGGGPVFDATTKIIPNQP